MKVRSAIFSALFMIHGVVMADECTTWGCVSTIESLYVNASGNIFVGTPLDETKANCTASSGVYFTLNTKSANAKEMYSSLLAAYMANNKVQLRIIEGSGNCELSYIRLGKL